MQHFDVAVIGSGTGNSIIDERFANLRVALVERDETFGGTCLNRGCIPTKMFVLPADLANAARDADRLGLDVEYRGARWRAIRDRIFGRIDPIAEAGLAYRTHSPNVTFFRGEASFVDAHTLRVGDEQFTADQIVIATGSRPRALDVEVPDELRSRVITSDEVMRIDELPRSLVILGGGYIAAEFAHVFSALGVEVTLVNRSDVMLRKHDRELAEAFTAQLRRRVNLQLNQSVSVIEDGPGDEMQVVTVDRNGVEYIHFADLVLVATGRVRNSDALNLAAAGVETREHGQIKVDAEQRTNVPHIFALGDVSSNHFLKHVANAEGRTVAHNLLADPADLVRTDGRYVPSAVFADPQIATVGATEEQLKEWGRPYVAATQKYADVAYGWALEDDGSHFVKLLADPGSWHLLGAHIMGPQAATLIQPLVQAMSFGLRVTDMARGQLWIHPGLPEVVENALLGLVQAHRPAELAAPEADEAFSQD